MRYLTQRDIKRYQMRFGAYDGANKRRFVLFQDKGGVTMRSEFDSKHDRDVGTRVAIAERFGICQTD